LLLTALAVGALVGAGCGDDGNDVGLTQRRVEERAAGLRAEAAAPATRDIAASDASSTDGDEPVEITSDAIDPTGVVVPVAALDNSFRPQVVEISVGDEVLWENRGLNEHNVLRVEGEGWGVDVHDFQPGAAYAHVFTEPGEYQYYCSIHGSETVGMVGTVIVTG
jgi:plastocyanin